MHIFGSSIWGTWRVHWRRKIIASNRFLYVVCCRSGIPLMTRHRARRQNLSHQNLCSPTETARPPSPPGERFFETPDFNTPEDVYTQATIQVTSRKRQRRLEEIWSISSDSSRSSSTTSTSPSLPTTIRYEEVEESHDGLNRAGF